MGRSRRLAQSRVQNRPLPGRADLKRPTRARAGAQPGQPRFSIATAPQADSALGNFEVLGQRECSRRSRCRARLWLVSPGPGACYGYAPRPPVAALARLQQVLDADSLLVVHLNQTPHDRLAS
jgi:hypothetical protein